MLKSIVVQNNSPIRALLTTLMVASALLCAGCSSTTVKTTDVVPVNVQNQEIEEAQLLDVGVTLFDPGINEKTEDSDEDDIVFAEVRNAEGRYFAHLLVKSLQTSAAWGAIRVIPSQNTSVDVVVEGKILHSDGERLAIQIKVSDSTGKHWYTRDYEALASRYSYDAKKRTRDDAFQNVYNQVTNDLLAYKRQLSKAEVINLRTVSELKFAQSFAPQTFAQHLISDSEGKLVVNRLPAENDPMLERIRQIRERDYLFIDTLQEYYSTFAKEMEDPYWRWRQESYSEVMALHSLQSSARNRIAAGAAALIAGIFAASNGGSAVTRTTGAVAMGAGGYIIKSGIDKSSESEMHVEALQELGDSLEAAIQPQIVELEGRTVTLTGSVNNQYQQWREILQEIYRIDSGIQVNQ